MVGGAGGGAGGGTGRGRRLCAGARALLRPAALAGVAVEAGWVGVHLALYPWGMLRERARREVHRRTVADLPPLQRALHVSDVEAAGTPIVLVHGLVDNRSIFALLRRRLRRRGFGSVVTFGYSPLTLDLRHAAALLSDRVERLCAETGSDRVHVVAHSLGGLVARYYVQRLGGDARVHTLVTLGTPHSGTATARLGPPYALLGQLRPGSSLLAELAEPVPGCRTRVVAIYSDLDQVVVPHRNARMDHPDIPARNLLVRGVGHMSLPINGAVVHEVCTTLTFLAPDAAPLPLAEPAAG